MLPILLVPAAILAVAPPPAVHGPVIEGRILNQAGQPVPASIGLIPMFDREAPFPAKTVANKTGRLKAGAPSFKLPVAAPGLYVLDIRARGCEPLQVPLVLDEQNLSGVEFTPVPLKLKGEAKPISSDPRMVKLESLFTAQKHREATYKKIVRARFEQKKSDPTISTKNAPLDWSADLEALAMDLSTESDPDILAMAAVSYLEMSTMMGRLDPAVAGVALDMLPPASPWWAFSPRSAWGALTISGRGSSLPAFREAMINENPDREVRSYVVYSQIAQAYRKGDKANFTALVNLMNADYKGTKYARMLKGFDPAKMPPPSASPIASPEPEPEVIAVEPETPVPAPEPAPAQP